MALILLNVINFDYAMTGLILILIFYLCRNKPWLGAAVYTLTYLPALNGNMADPLALKIGGHAIGFEIFALLALPFIYMQTNSRIKNTKVVLFIFIIRRIFSPYILLEYCFKNFYGGRVFRVCLFT